MTTRRSLRFESRIYLYAVIAGLPGTVTALVLVWTQGFPTRVEWTATLVMLTVWLGFASAVRRRVVYPLRTISNLLSALREGDFSLRARPSKHDDDALAEVFAQVNAISDTLMHQRSSALEATALLRKVMTEIDVAIFTFDEHSRLKLVNRAGETMLATPAERLLDLSAEEIGLADLLIGAENTTMRREFPGASGVWGVRRGEFREGGVPHILLVLSDLTRPLREEELLAWQRLVRVVGHEINNSLTPVKSIAESLASLLSRDPLPEDWRDDAMHGLRIVASRAEGLNRFTTAYAKLARHPAPRLQPVRVAEWVQRAASLEKRIEIAVEPGEDVIIPGDADQLDQLLINLVRNGVDAALESGGGAVRVRWLVSGSNLEVAIEDNGPGIANTNNLFVPFFTTKPNGSGIGLVLSRQIAEAHGGTVTLAGGTSGTGCVALLALPRG